MADDRIFTLVGKFDDKITPSLAKLSKSITGLTRDFDKLKRNLRPIAKDMAIMAEGANRISDGFKNQRGSIDTAVRGLAEYRREMGKATAAQQKFQRQVKLPTLSGDGSTRRPRSGGGRGGSGGAQAEAGGMQKMGLGAMALAGGAVGVGFTAATAALNKIRSSIGGFVQAGSQAEQAVIGMAGTLQTLGKVGDFQKSRRMAEDMMGNLSKVAAALPGSTADYLTILQQTLDDQITAFGSVEAVQQNLKGIGKDGKKLAGGMEQSFTALFGMAAQISGLAPQVAAADLNQLRMNPSNLRQVQVLSRNPTLSKFYLEELKKSGGDFILALNNAMKKAITPEQVEALKNSFDSAYQSFTTTFTDAYSGIIAPMRKVTIKIHSMVNGVATTMDQSVSSMEILGVIMRNINDIVAVLLGTGIDPLVMLNQFLYEFGYQVYKLKRDLEYFAKDGLNLEEFGEAIGRAIGDAAANLGNWLANLDYEKFFQGVDKLVYGFFKGLFSAFLKSFKGTKSGEKGPLGGLGTSVTGTIVTLAALALSLKRLTQIVGMASLKIAAGGFARGAAGVQGPMQSASAQRAMQLGSSVRNSFRGTFAGRAGTRMQQFAQNRMPMMGGVGGRMTGMMGKMGSGMKGIGAKLGGASGGATALTAITGLIDTVSTISEYDSQIKEVNAAITAASASGDTKSVAALLKEKENLQKQKGETGAAGVGGVVGAVAGGALGAAVAGPIGAMIGSQLGQAIGTNVGPAIGNWWNGTAWPAISGAWTGLTSALSTGWNAFTSMVSNVFNSLKQGIESIPTKIGELVGKITQAFQNLPGPLKTAISLAFAPAIVVLNLIRSGIQAVAGVIGKLKMPSLPSWLGGPKPPPGGTTGGKPTNNRGGGQAGTRWNGKDSGTMPLHSAIASEMANKPSGSHLVIANSSETIIPAAGGLGSMDGMVNAIYGAAQNTAGAFSAGFQSFSQKVTAGQQATVAAINKGTQTASTQNAAMLAKLSAQNAALMAKISASPAFMGAAGAMGAMALGGGYGSRGSQIAGALGTYIKKTGGAPGSIHEHPQHGGVKGKHSKNSYHYQGRAIDIGAYSYEQGGVLRRIAQFNAQMGVKPVELLKAGDPGHSDHVHVAYALGSGNPAFFSSASAADKWESMMAGKNPIVGSVRAQANEMRGGGSMTVNAPITINAQPGQDTDQLASLVAIKLTQAVNQLRYSSYNV